MTLNLMMPDQADLKPSITVFGVGGAGGNAVNNMIAKELDGVEFVVANTDAQALQQSASKHRIQLGVKVTEGLGAGARASVGAAAAEESIEQIVDQLAGSHMCFITAGMGGGTGTGAAPIIAQAARELGVLTVGVVTKPFQFEGAKRMRQAEDGVDALQKVVDTLIIIPNQNLFRLANEKTTFTEAFSLADDVLYQGVKGVTDLMVRPGLINLDFADVRAVMDEMGKAMMGTGEAEGEDRATQAAEKAIANPLLDEISLRGAKGVLINITGGNDLTLFELDEAANRIREEVDPEANIIVGSTLDESIEGGMRVSVVATGIDALAVDNEIPIPRRPMARPLAPTIEAEPVNEDIVEPQVQMTETPSMEAAAEPSLFGEMDAERAAASEQMEDIFEEELLEDELPAPVYQARVEEFVPQAIEEDEVEAFVAPKAPAPGTPSADAMRRLQAAVSKAPTGAPAAPRPAATEAAPHAESHAQHAQADDRGGRFGLNSLIGRMTGGHGAEQPAARPAASPAPQARQQPSMHAVQPEPEMDEDQERIEIPAFLRRQAN
ncbi:Cell division protein FtsZ [Shimia thalassica]|uniref:Cell division protein FtsZ n=1 Tax=Shimia thalassica TaxID=1715693 RepID=A0A0N7M8Q5_9RHOB|nr:cell division protein FtsZ [Shimia thalassica]CUJ89766.1 Cell division protein FtsZ [Shimia thalassica]